MRDSHIFEYWDKTLAPIALAGGFYDEAVDAIGFEWKKDCRWICLAILFENKGIHTKLRPMISLLNMEERIKELGTIMASVECHIDQSLKFIDSLNPARQKPKKRDRQTIESSPVDTIASHEYTTV